MRAIETRYKGRLFRSRLEARYAVLFDALGIQWDYEPEGFEFSDGTRYLPDFWLKVPDKPGQGYWIEVKAGKPTPPEVHKLTMLAVESGHRCWFLTGTPGEGIAETVPRIGIGGSGCSHRWCAPVVACARAPVSESVWEKAKTTALSARFEFGGRA